MYVWFRGFHYLSTEAGSWRENQPLRVSPLSRHKEQNDRLNPLETSLLS